MTASPTVGEAGVTILSHRLVRHLLALAVYLVVTGLYFAPLIIHLDSRVLVGFTDATSAIRDYDVIDAAGSTPFTFHRDVLNGAPEGIPTLAQPSIVQPVQPSVIWVLRDLVGTVAAFNLFLLAGFVLTAFAGFALLDWVRLGIVPSLFGGFVMAFNPYMVERAILGHVGFNHGWTLILLLGALTKLRMVRTLRWAALAGLAFGFCFLLSAYMGLLATALVVSFGIVDLVSQRSGAERLWTFTLLSLMGGVTLLTLAPYFLSFALDHDTISTGLSHGAEVLQSFGARPDEYLLPHPIHPVLGWAGHLRRHYATFPEQRVFVGYVVLGLAAVTALRLLRHTTRLPSRAAHHLAVLAAVSVPVAFVASMQSHLTVLGLRIPMPSHFAGQVTTFYRVYARFGYVVELGLAVLAAACLYGLLDRGRRGRVLGVVAIAVTVFEFLPGTIPAPAIDKAPLYDVWLARQPPGIAAHYPPKASSAQAQLMGFKESYYQRFTGQPLFEYYASSLVSARIAAIRLQSADPEKPETLGILAAERVRYLVVHDDVYRAQGTTPPVLGAGVKLLRTFGPVRVYQLTATPIDLERHLRENATQIADQLGLARPAVSYGGGFYPPETVKGFTTPFQWMRQGGEVDIENEEGEPVEIWLEGFGFSNGTQRRLDLVDATGRRVATVDVPSFLIPLRFGPFEVPAGASRLTLQATPGPVPLGDNDTREASVYLSDLRASRKPDLTRKLRKSG